MAEIQHLLQIEKKKNKQTLDRCCWFRARMKTVHTGKPLIFGPQLNLNPKPTAMAQRKDLSGENAFGSLFLPLAAPCQLDSLMTHYLSRNFCLPTTQKPMAEGERWAQPPRKATRKKQAICSIRNVTGACPEGGSPPTNSWIRSDANQQDWAVWLITSAFTVPHQL